MSDENGLAATYLAPSVMPWQADDVLGAVDELLGDNPVLPPSREAARALVEVVVDVVQGATAGAELQAACRHFAQTTDHAPAVLSCVAAIHQGLSRVASVDGRVGRWHVDEVSTACWPRSWPTC